MTSTKGEKKMKETSVKKTKYCKECKQQKTVINWRGRMCNDCYNLQRLKANRDEKSFNDIKSGKLHLVKSAKQNVYKVSVVKIKDLKIDPAYQRDVSEPKVMQILQDFDWCAFGHILVNIREDGKAWLIDGQHRCKAVQLGSLSIDVNMENAVPCLMMKGLTRKGEAELFVKHNKNRNAPRPGIIFKSRYAAEDEEAIKIIDTVGKHGLYIDFKGTSSYTMRSRGFISSVANLENIIKRHSLKHLDKTLQIISRCWKDEDSCQESALRSRFIYSLSSLLNKMKKNNIEINIEKMVKAFKKREAKSFYEAAKNNKRVYPNTGITKGFEIEFLAAFNKGKKIEHQIRFPN